MHVAATLATRATCRKRQVGCVLTDERQRILSSGYNGVPAGQPHCIDTPCIGADQPSGSDSCQAVHAEINALLQCRNVDAIHSCYVTVLPCNNCMKTLLNTPCQVIYTYDDSDEPAAARLWRNSGRKIIKCSN